MCAWLGGVHGWAEQGYGELETSPAVALLGLGLTALGGLTWGLELWVG